ncbi:MAG TPA: hypothetical protein VN457_06080, partial [Chlamydiales bacterium]|nr:hypothetical protein [Chlamydiales bacterium]
MPTLAQVETLQRSEITSKSHALEQGLDAAMAGRWNHEPVTWANSAIHMIAASISSTSAVNEQSVQQLRRLIEKVQRADVIIEQQYWYRETGFFSYIRAIFRFIGLYRASQKIDEAPLTHAIDEQVTRITREKSMVLPNGRQALVKVHFEDAQMKVQEMIAHLKEKAEGLFVMIPGQTKNEFKIIVVEKTAEQKIASKTLTIRVSKLFIEMIEQRQMCTNFHEVIEKICFTTQEKLFSLQTAMQMVMQNQYVHSPLPRDPEE